MDNLWNYNYYAPKNLTNHTSKWFNFPFCLGGYNTKVNFKVVVSFDLVLKSDNSIIYTHSRVFDAVNQIANKISRPVYYSGYFADFYNKLPEWMPQM